MLTEDFMKKQKLPKIQLKRATKVSNPILAEDLQIKMKDMDPA